MDNDSFRKYRFSINMQVKYRGRWYDIIAVDFGRHSVETEHFIIVSSLIEEIREKK